MAMSFRSGYFSRSSSQAIAPDWYVVLRPEEKPMTRMSRPSCSFCYMTAVNSETLTALVVARSPSRSLS